MSSSPGLPKAALTALDPDHFDLAEWRKLTAFSELSAEDVKRLLALSRELEPYIERTVDRFYSHLESCEDTRRLLADPAVVRRLRDSQAQYLRTLFAGSYDEDYLRDRLRTGLTHERIGLPLRWYLGGYWLYLRELVPVLLRDLDDARIGELLAFLKVLVLDMQVISEAYVGRTMSLVRQQNERLEQIVTERTRQLNQWERLAAVGSMSAKVAHEIRNPLSSISLNTELLADELAAFRGVNTGEALDLLESISGELDRLKRIVDEYLQFARMPRLELEPVDLVGLVEDVAEFLEEEFARLGIRFSFDGERDLPPIALDRDQFRQVLLNLFRNAQEAMPAGGSLKVAIASQRNGSVLLRVQDTGVGIDPVHADNLFDPFYTTKDTGTGLGLPFVQQVVQELRGEIRVRGEQGRGASFDILLPEELVMRGETARPRARYQRG